MAYRVSLTLKQLSVLRLMLRLQKVRVIRNGFRRYARDLDLLGAMAPTITATDQLQAVDLQLMLIEAQVVARAGSNPDLVLTMDLTGEDLGVCDGVAKTMFGVESDYGSPSDQIRVLAAVNAEAEGIRLALSTATPPQEVPVGIFQAQPAGRQ